MKIDRRREVLGISKTAYQREKKRVTAIGPERPEHPLIAALARLSYSVRVAGDQCLTPRGRHGRAPKAPRISRRRDSAGRGGHRIASTSGAAAGRLFLASGVLAGKDTAPIFIENGRSHGERIVKVLAERRKGILA